MLMNWSESSSVVTRSADSRKAISGAPAEGPASAVVRVRRLASSVIRSLPREP